MQDDLGCRTLIHWEERALRLAVHLEVALFHAAVLAVVHPVRALQGGRRLAPGNFIARTLSRFAPWHTEPVDQA